MQIRSFIPYETVHSGSGKYFPTMDHIPKEYKDIFDEILKDEDIIKQFTDILNNALSTWYDSDKTDVCNKIIKTISEGVNMLVVRYIYRKTHTAYFGSLDETLEDRPLTLQMIIDYYMIRLYSLLDEQMIKGSHDRKSLFLRIEPHCYPIETYFENHTECITYRVYLDLIDFDKKTRHMHPVCNIQDNTLVDLCKQFEQMQVFGPYGHITNNSTNIISIGD